MKMILVIVFTLLVVLLLAFASPPSHQITASDSQTWGYGGVR